MLSVIIIKIIYRSKYILLCVVPIIIIVGVEKIMFGIIFPILHSYVNITWYNTSEFGVHF